MLSIFQNVIGWLIWLVLVAAQAPAYVLGWLVVPFTNRGPYNGDRDPMPSWYREGQPEWLRDYVWRAWRNPLPGWKYLVDEPVGFMDEGYGSNNPDIVVYSGLKKSSWWYIRSGIFVEYWYLRAVGSKKFEFRIGWKFGTEPGFAPSFSLRLGD